MTPKMNPLPRIESPNIFNSARVPRFELPPKTRRKGNYTIIFMAITRPGRLCCWAQASKKKRRENNKQHHRAAAAARAHNWAIKFNSSRLCVFTPWFGPPSRRPTHSHFPEWFESTATLPLISLWVFFLLDSRTLLRAVQTINVALLLLNA